MTSWSAPGLGCGLLPGWSGFLAAPAPALATVEPGVTFTIPAPTPGRAPVEEAGLGRAPVGLGADTSLAASNDEGPEGRDAGDDAAPGGLDARADAGPEGLDAEDAAAPKGLDAGDDAAPEGLDAGDDATPEGLIAGEDAAPEGLDAGEDPAPEGREEGDDAAPALGLAGLPPCLLLAPPWGMFSCFFIWKDRGQRLPSCIKVYCNVAPGL